jgi:hypothetical protein
MVLHFSDPLDQNDLIHICDVFSHETALNILDSGIFNVTQSLQHPTASKATKNAILNRAFSGSTLYKDAVVTMSRTPHRGHDRTKKSWNASRIYCSAIPKLEKDKDGLNEVLGCV